MFNILSDSNAILKDIEKKEISLNLWMESLILHHHSLTNFAMLLKFGHILTIFRHNISLIDAERMYDLSDQCLLEK